MERQAGSTPAARRGATAAMKVPRSFNTEVAAAAEAHQNGADDDVKEEATVLAGPRNNGIAADGMIATRYSPFSGGRIFADDGIFGFRGVATGDTAGTAADRSFDLGAAIDDGAVEIGTTDGVFTGSQAADDSLEGNGEAVPLGLQMQHIDGRLAGGMTDQLWRQVSIL